MARNGSGTYSNPYPNFVSGTVISSAETDANNSDIATALTQSIAVDGQAVVTANIPLATHKLTGVSAGSAATDSLSLGQAQAEAFIWCGTAGGSADAITLAPSPAITAYAAGQRFVWMASSSVNTGATTVAISGLTAIALQDNGAALAAGTHAANKMFMGILNTTSTVQIMQVQSSGTDPLIVSSLTVSGTSALTGVTTHGDDVVSDTDSTDDLGTTSVRWANLFVDGITATDQITATGFTGTLDGILGSGAAAAASVTTLTASDVVSVDDTTDTTSGTTGSIHTDGGLGIAKKLHVIGTTTHGGNVISDTDSTDDLGTTGVRWANLFVDAITATDQITATGFTGTLDGALGGGTPAAASITTLTLTNDLTVANGGTGASTHTANNVLVGAGTSAIASVAPSTSGNVLTSNGSAWTSAAAGGGDLLASNNLSDVASAATSFGNIKQAASASATGVVELLTDAELATGTDTSRAATAANIESLIIGKTEVTVAAGDSILLEDATDNALKRDTVQGILDLVPAASGTYTMLTEQATTSGTTKDFTIPSGATQIILMWENGSTTSTIDPMLVQLGDAGGIETSGYTGAMGQVDGTYASNTSSTSGLVLCYMSNTLYVTAVMTFYLYDPDTFQWIATALASHWNTGTSSGGRTTFATSTKALSAELTTVRLMNGTFDAGSVNVGYK
jgi:hypothetical protein